MNPDPTSPAPAARAAPTDLARLADEWDAKAAAYDAASEVIPKNDDDRRTMLAQFISAVALRDCAKALRAALRAESPQAEDAAVYYLSDGSEARLPREEVERRRKAAAKVIGAARDLVRERRRTGGVGGHDLRALAEALEALGEDAGKWSDVAAGLLACVSGPATPTPTTPPPRYVLTERGRAPSPEAIPTPTTPPREDETEALEVEVARLRVKLDAAADGLRSAAKYLRHVNAFAFAEQVEIDERHARAPSPEAKPPAPCAYCLKRPATHTAKRCAKNLRPACDECDAVAKARPTDTCAGCQALGLVGLVPCLDHPEIPTCPLCNEPDDETHHVTLGEAEGTQPGRACIKGTGWRPEAKPPATTRDEPDDLALCVCGHEHDLHGGPYGDGCCGFIPCECEAFTPAAPAPADPATAKEPKP